MNKKENKKQQTKIKTTSGLPSQKISNTSLKTIIKAKWFPSVLFLLLALLYFTPHLGLNKIIMGTDDGPRGWHTVGNQGHGFNSFFDKWSPLNGGTAMMERRWGRFINPTHIFHLFMKKYQARTLEYIFWTFIAGFFMFLFLRGYKISLLASYVGGMVYMFAPAFQSYIFAGHFARMEVIALMPAIMFFTERMLKRAALLDIAGLATVLALAYYSEHVQLAYFVCIGMGFYYALRMLHMVFIKKEITISEGTKRSGFFAAALVVGLMLTSMTSFPTIHHANVTSKRAGGVDYDYASSWGLHNEEIFSLFQPDFIGWKEFYWGQNALKFNLEYFGVIFLILAMMLFVFRKQDFTKYLLAGLFVFGVLFSLGKHTPLHPILYNILPGMKSFRAPSFMYIWFFLSGIALSAFAIDEILALKWGENSVLKKRLLIFAGIVTGFAFIYMITNGGFAKWWYNSLYPAEMQMDKKYNALMHNIKNIQLGGVLIFVYITSFFTACYFKAKGSINKNILIAIVILIATVDLIPRSQQFLKLCTRPANYFKKQETVEQSIQNFLYNRDKTNYRVHSMMGDQKQYITDLDLTYIFDDFTNQRYNDIVQLLQQSSYALQNPQYASNTSLQTRFRNSLSILNTKYIISLSQLKVPGLKEIINSGGLRIYENIFTYPRFYLSSSIDVENDTKTAIMKQIDLPNPSKNIAIVNKEQWQNKKLSSEIDSTINSNIKVIEYDTRKGHTLLEVTSNREQIIVISENFNSGWTATVNDNKSDIFNVNYYAKGVIVPKGKSKVELIYNSPIATFWRKVTAITAIAFFFFVLVAVYLEIKKLKLQRLKLQKEKPGQLN